MGRLFFVWPAIAIGKAGIERREASNQNLLHRLRSFFASSARPLVFVGFGEGLVCRGERGQASGGDFEVHDCGFEIPGF